MANIFFLYDNESFRRKSSKSGSPHPNDLSISFSSKWRKSHFSPNIITLPFECRNTLAELIILFHTLLFFLTYGSRFIHQTQKSLRIPPLQYRGSFNWSSHNISSYLYVVFAKIKFPFKLPFQKEKNLHLLMKIFLFLKFLF